MNVWQWVIIVWFAINAFLYVAMIDKTITYTKRSALVQLPIYAALIYMAVRTHG